MGLLDDLNDARRANIGPNNNCLACKTLLETEDDETRETLTACLAGTISQRAMMIIARKNNLGWGRDTIRRHHDEGHTL